MTKDREQKSKSCLSNEDKQQKPLFSIFLYKRISMDYDLHLHWDMCTLSLLPLHCWLRSPTKDLFKIAATKPLQQKQTNLKDPKHKEP